MHTDMKVVSLATLLCLAISATYARAETGASVVFSDCSEFVGEGPIAFASTQNLVPPGYTITGSSSASAQMVVRDTACRALTVNGFLQGPAIIAHVGINVAPPDGSGDINNYTLIYVTSSFSLAAALRHLGLPAIYNPEITYEFTPTGNGQSGTLYAEVSGLGLPPYFLYGAETNPPPGSGQPFLANWWFNGRHGQIKMSTDFPVIAFGTPDEILYTSKASLVGRLIGGNTYSNFSTLSLRGVYQSAQMIVTVNP